MHSRSAGWCAALLVGLVPLAADAGPETRPPVAATAAAPAAVPVAAPATAALPFAAVDSAIAELKRDPNLGGESKVRSLKWTEASTPTTVKDSPSWIVGLFNYLGQISGLLLWVLGGGAVALAAIWIFRHVGFSKRVPQPEAAPLVGSVLDLDLRPSSLPEDVRGAALALSHAGRLREALSLLYRASLSRAVNRFGVIIGASLTEREALRTVRAALDDSRGQFFADLVLTWQRLVYAGEAVAQEDVATLCARFGDTLDVRPT